ncbi:L,D-transpeptidase [Halomonas sp. SSL-5]|uniref:L,D-transpeptidase family protein n=1 Tax=Halomonas sp. SSL-5 TaxID=3065855 RepID=UPI0027383F5F|nr:L,D-transpeptidase [Halomonas sp. SSL-5]MDY7117277.1 L,D-transpeptidase [Halomonas sp. SSL-5]
MPPSRLFRTLKRCALTSLTLMLAAGPAVASLIDTAEPPSSVVTSSPGPHFLDEVDTGISLLPVDDGVVWLHLSVKDRRLSVVRGHRVIHEIPHFAIGINGAVDLRTRGSAMTPKGVFRVERINPNSRFATFIGINYPNPRVADQALAQGVISMEEAQRIHRHYRQHRLSYPDTTLGGNIGIHGLGNRDPFLNRRVDWTEGCLAVENDQVRLLHSLVEIDTPVLIQ